MTSDSIYYSLAAFLLCFAVITFLAILQLRNTMSNRSNWIQSLNDRVRYFRFCLNLLVLASSLLGLLTTAILLFYAMSDLRSSGSLFEQAFHVTLSLLLFASQYVVSCICQLHFWTLADKLGTNDETYNVVWKVANWFVGVVGLGGIAAGGTFCFSSDFDYALSVPVMRLSTCVGMLIFALLWLAMLLRLRALVHSATRELTRRSSNVDCGGEDEMMNSPPRSSRHRRSASTVQSMTMLTGRIRDLLLEGILFFLLAAVYCLLEFAATVYSPDILDGRAFDRCLRIERAGDGQPVVPIEVLVLLGALDAFLLLVTLLYWKSAEIPTMSAAARRNSMSAMGSTHSLARRPSLSAATFQTETQAAAAGGGGGSGLQRFASSNSTVVSSVSLTSNSTPPHTHVRKASAPLILLRVRPAEPVLLCAGPM